MTFRFTVKQNPLEIEFEAGSIGEGLAILQTEGSKLAEFFVTASHLAIAQSNGESAGSEATTGNAAEPGKRKRRSNAEIAADNARIAAASAPPPAPVPGAAPPAPPAAAPPPPAPAPSAPIDTTDNGHGTPAFLVRTAAPPAPAAAAAAPPPPPPAPAAVAAPAITLAPKIIAECKRRAALSVDGGKLLADWLATTGIVVKGASFDEAMAVLQFHDDAKMKPVADALLIS